jgi:hypothetical protein
MAACPQISTIKQRTIARVKRSVVPRNLDLMADCGAGGT